MRNPVVAARFVRRLRVLTAAGLGPALYVSARLGGLFLAALVAASVLVPIGPRVRLGFRDHRHGPALTGAVVAFDIVWMSSLLALIVTPLVAIVGLMGSFGLLATLERAVFASIALGIYGVLVRRLWTRVRRIDVRLAGLPSSFDGYRIVQLSDIHVGTTNRARAAMRWARTTNALAPDLVVVTGDLVSSGTAFHEEVAEVLGSVRAKDGVLGCLGNHDYYDEDTLCRLLGERGVRVLRNDGVAIARDGREIFVAGVEDFWRGRPDLEAACSRSNGAPVVLLAHNPDYFPVAREGGVALTLSGHTHAGQLAVPFLVEYLNLSRIATRFTAGVYRDGDSVLFVHSGLGTTGPAFRIGAAPEIVEITLRAAA